MLSEVDEDLVELAAPQQVEVLNDLREDTNVTCVPFAL